MTKIKPSSSSLSASSTLSRKSNTNTKGTVIHSFFTKPTKEPITQSSKSSKSMQYKANPELAELSHRIYKGEKINAKIPPENITYEMLVKEVGDIDLILNNEQKSKEELRIELWNIWYKIIAGYSKYDTTNTNGHKKSTRSTQHKKTGGNPMDELLAEMEKIEENILNETPDEKKDREDSYFLFAFTNARQAVIESLQKKKQLENLKKILEKKSPEFIIDLIKTSIITYPLGNKINKLYKPSKDFYMYGMQLPHQFDRLKLLKTIFYLFNNKIYNIVDLHNCANATNREHPLMSSGIGCNPYDRKCEPEIWEIAKDIVKTQAPSFNTKYYNVIGYKDMRAGSLSAWEIISTIKDINKPSNSVVIHCFAGAGRTGSVMLFLLLRDFPKNKKFFKQRFALPHFGYTDISKFIKTCINFFTNKTPEVSFMKRELFKISTIMYASLLRQRLNRIFFFLARHFKIETFYTYERPSMVVVNLPDDEFSNPTLHTIDWASFDSGNFKKDSILHWLN